MMWLVPELAEVETKVIDNTIKDIGYGAEKN